MNNFDRVTFNYVVSSADHEHPAIRNGRLIICHVSNISRLIFFELHCPPKVKVQSALLFSSFVHNSLINELKKLKLSEHICYEMIH